MLTREQVEWLMSSDEDSPHSNTHRRMRDHDAEQRQTIEAQVQRIKELESASTNSDEVRDLLNAAMAEENEYGSWAYKEILHRFSMQAQRIRELEHQLADTVPRSRYDACNKDWLNEQKCRREDHLKALAYCAQLEAELARVKGQLTVDEDSHL